VGRFDEAQKLYETILNETPDLREKGNLYRKIGSIKADQGEYKEAITFYEKALLKPNYW